MTTSPTTSLDAIQFHEGASFPVDVSKTSSDDGKINLSDQMEGRIVIEEATSDDVLGKVGTLDSPQLGNDPEEVIEDGTSTSDVDKRSFHKASTPLMAGPVSGFYQAYPAKSVAFESDRTSAGHLLKPEDRVLLQNYWRSALNNDAEIIIGEYTLPSINAPLGISVETLGNIDRMGRQTDFKHQIIEVHGDGVVAKQTELKPMDEVLEVSGVTVMGKDSTILTVTLQKPPISGYLVCSRSSNTTSNQKPSLIGEKMSVIPEVSSAETTQSDTVPIELESGTERADTISSSDSKISDLRRKFEAFSQEMTPTPLKALVEEKVEEIKVGQRPPTQPREARDESLGPSDPSINLTNDPMEIVINKAKGELIGVTLGQRDDMRGGFTVTDISPNGALRRTLNSVVVYHRVPFNVGDVVTELNGKPLHHATLFGVQSLLWSMFSLEGNVSLKFMSKLSNKPQLTLSTEAHEECLLDKTPIPETTAAKSNASSVPGNSRLSSSGPFLLNTAPPAAETSAMHVPVSSMENTRLPPKSPERLNEAASSDDNSLTQSTNLNPNLGHSTDQWVPPHGFIKLMVERYMRTARST
ncbi:hypothetical protein TcWFU_001109 [Taenia crassiceps]|uniref:PDZ domain-containing protein n=1 Tax=Taenia crassiceps TaxID=6207 RepID=A0ABR4QCS6_9CEST